MSNHPMSSHILGRALEENLNTSPRDKRTYGTRLLKLRDYLKSRSDGKYNHLNLVSRCNASHPCQSVACAFGHAVISGKFHGLRHLKLDSRDIVRRGRNLDSWGKFINTEAEADAFFGPSTWDAIFGTWSWFGCPTRKDVVVRMTEFADQVFGVTRNA